MLPAAGNALFPAASISRAVAVQRRLVAAVLWTSAAGYRLLRAGGDVADGALSGLSELRRGAELDAVADERDPARAKAISRNIPKTYIP